MRRFIVVVAVVSLVLAACSGGGGAGGGATGGTQGPVTITFWHSEVASPSENLVKLVDEFNASQADVRVNLVFQGNPTELALKLLAGLPANDVPSVAYLSEAFTGTMIDSQKFVPLQQFIDRDKYDLSGLSPAALSSYTVNGALEAMPWCITVPLMYYNKIPFREVGLDPEHPPRDLDEARQVSEKFVVRDGSGNLVRTGFALDIQPWYVEFMLAGANQPYVNNDNGYSGRATAVAFDSPAGREVFGWWHDMVQQGLAVNVGRNPTGADNLLAVGGKRAVITFSDSNSLRSIVDVLGQQHIEGVELGVAPVPGVPGAVASGSPGVYSRSLWIMSGRPRAEQEAGWKFIQWLMQPLQQAEWFAGSAYLPVRDDAYDQPPARDIVAQYPAFQLPVDLFRKTAAGYNALPPLVGPLQQIQDGISDAIESMVSGNASADDALAAAARHGDEVIRQYNDKLGQ